MPESTLLAEKYQGNLSDLRTNNLYAHGTKKRKLFPGPDWDGILKTGLENSSRGTEDTLARNMLYSAGPRFGGSAVDGVLVLYRPPKGRLALDNLPFPPSTTHARNDRAEVDKPGLGSEHMAFWLETVKSGIESYVKESFEEVLENLSENVDVIGKYVDGLAKLIEQHALVPNAKSPENYHESNIDETHIGIDIDTATTYACEILWNSTTERLFFKIDVLKSDTDELLEKASNSKETERLVRILIGKEKEPHKYSGISIDVIEFSAIWKQFKDVSLPYEELQEEIEKRMSVFYENALKVEQWIEEVMEKAEEQKNLQETPTESRSKNLMTVVKRVFRIT
jgi:hypothetical protein